MTRHPSGQNQDSRNFLRGRSVLLGDQLLIDLRLLDQRVQDVQHGITTPDLRVLGEHGELVFRLVLDDRTPLSKGLELVDKLVEHVPEPLDGEVERDGLFRVCSEGGGWGGGQ
jgi:hypothetical protein